MFSSAARNDASHVHGCQRRNAWRCPDGCPGMHGRHDRGAVTALASRCAATYLRYRLNNHHRDSTDVRSSPSYSPRLGRAARPPAARGPFQRAVARHRAQPRSGRPLCPFAPRSDSPAQAAAPQRPHPGCMTASPVHRVRSVGRPRPAGRIRGLMPVERGECPRGPAPGDMAVFEQRCDAAETVERPAPFTEWTRQPDRCRKVLFERPANDHVPSSVDPEASTMSRRGGGLPVVDHGEDVVNTPDRSSAAVRGSVVCRCPGRSVQAPVPALGLLVMQPVTRRSGSPSLM